MSSNTEQKIIFKISYLFERQNDRILIFWFIPQISVTRVGIRPAKAADPSHGWQAGDQFLETSLLSSQVFITHLNLFIYSFPLWTSVCKINHYSPTQATSIMRHEFTFKYYSS